jgi:hypothetical protein
MEPTTREQTTEVNPSLSVNRGGSNGWRTPYGEQKGESRQLRKIFQERRDHAAWVIDRCRVQVALLRSSLPARNESRTTAAHCRAALVVVLARVCRVLTRRPITPANHRWRRTGPRARADRQNDGSGALRGFYGRIWSGVAEVQQCMGTGTVLRIDSMVEQTSGFCSAVKFAVTDMRHCPID